ncbi:thioredoxin-like domain-containing protein [uncultured Flavobacterium sp.]|uniref:TlpA family protein disulfide reductase n=1 Tax=uncultured Flavobacterium sp. TaxID=165435 RepID=UPI0030CA1404|tara:strand:+ start:2530 stop:3933 length:1404 start_codon:yes stop_codon:yes gene_type:complete
MIKKIPLLTFIITIIGLTSFLSCNKNKSDDDFSAYFGGEILNPQSNYVLFMKNNKLLDTLFLDNKNRFLHKFDSLTPGLYLFKHQPEYQYVYFDKNDSLMIIVNANDFDNSIVYCGKGDEKNNYLMEMYLSNDKDRSNMYDVFFRKSDKFIKNIDSSFAIRKKIYDKYKAKVDWNDRFDSLALASLNFSHYYKKEVYPYAHKYITGENVISKLPLNYYSHRKHIDFNNPSFINYSPFINYVTSLLNNITFTDNKGNIDEFVLENNINKLNIADTLIKNNAIKNNVLNGLALSYLMKEQNMIHNSTFIKRFLELSTDKKMQDDVIKIENTIKKLTAGNKLSLEKFVNENNKVVELDKLIKKQTVIFFFNTKLQSHLNAVHRKVANLKNKHPNVNFIAVNIDDNFEDWKSKLNEIDHKDIMEIHASDSEILKKDWIVYKIHRTMILNADGTIKNAFVNLFDVNFEKNLE